MTWKISKKQADLKKQLEDSLKTYNQASKALDKMLLKMLHRQGVYTPDDFHRKYTARGVSSDRLRVIASQQTGHHLTNRSMMSALTNLSAALIQFKDAVKNKSIDK